MIADGGPDGETFRARLRGETIAGPDLLRIEVMSVIRRHLRTGALSAAQSERAVADLIDLPVSIYPSAHVLRRAWQLRDNVSPFDACYVALAEALGCPLLTADVRLANAPGARCAIEVI